MTTNMAKLMREQARLIILKALADQNDERLNSDLMVHELAPFGISKDRAWVHEEFGYLEEMGAIVVHHVGSLQVAELAQKGHRHLTRQITIEGVQRPSRPGA
jgi:phage regulator Rha-like protein